MLKRTEVTVLSKNMHLPQVAKIRNWWQAPETALDPSHDILVLSLLLNTDCKKKNAYLL